MVIEELSLSAIKPYEKNPRKNEGAVDGVAKSIQQFGFQQEYRTCQRGLAKQYHSAP